VSLGRDNLLHDREVGSLAARSQSNGGGSIAEGCVRHRIVEMGELTVADIDRWLELRASNPALDSPYFHPAFVTAVAAARPGVRVIIGEDTLGAVTAFLPVQFDKRTCHPAGFPAVDFQGPICAPGFDFDIATALSTCGASMYEFDHLRDSLAAFERWIFGRQQSPFVDVSGGMDGYLTRASKSGKDKVAEARRLARRAEREFGPVRFVAESADAALLDTVIALKRRQYSITGSRDYFSDARHVDLLHRLLATSDTDCGGMLSAVYAGPHLLAAHFGLRAGPVLHWWFPTYDPEFSRLSPGWLLLRAVIDAAPELGLARIDLGRGIDDYKRRAMTGHQLVCQGAVIRNPLRRGVVLARRRLLEAIKSSPVAPALRSAVRNARSRSH
jgi:CelD/BcsL family acetyltransferase involved in cellulose biosynthesis